MDQEKSARLAIEARVAQLVEDAAGLRDWAVMQVGALCILGRQQWALRCERPCMQCKTACSCHDAYTLPHTAAINARTPHHLTLP